MSVCLCFCVYIIDTGPIFNIDYIIFGFDFILIICFFLLIHFALRIIMRVCYIERQN